MQSHEGLKDRSARWGCAMATFVGGTLVTASAAAQFGTGFENPPYNGSGGGTTLNGQDGFYLPAAGGVSANVYTYAGNALGLPVNPTGGDQFVGGTGPGGNVFVRSQRDVSFGSGTWRIAYDFAVTFTGQLPSAQNIGSFSLQDSVTSAFFIALPRWTDPNTAATWNADYVWYNGAGTQVTEAVADTRFQNLQINHWYRWSTVVNFDTNQILEVSITDIVGGGTATHNPVDRYLQGGSTGGFPLPTGFRLFAGAGAVAGNTTAFDNLSIGLIPAPGAIALLGVAGLTVRRRRRTA